MYILHPKFENPNHEIHDKNLKNHCGTDYIFASIGMLMQVSMQRNFV